MKIEFVNLEDIVPTGILSSLGTASVNEIIQDIADAARSEWMRIAGEELTTTRRDYLNGIQPVVFKDGTAVIALVGEFPNLIEDGMDEVDMHDTLLGPNVPVAPVGARGKHPSKDGGFYRSIPFRHGTPGTQGGGGRAMGEAYSGSDVVKDAKALGRQVYKAAKVLKPTKSQPGGPTIYGERLPKGVAPKLRPSYHATDIYAGMIRQKTSAKTNQSQYTTFRTIAVDAAGRGKGSSPWIRPATAGKNIAARVNTFVQKIAPQAFAAYVESLK